MATFTLLPDLLKSTAASHPNRLALVSPAWHLTFGDVHARTNALAHALVRRGVRSGDPVVLFGRGAVQTAMELWAVLKANGVGVLVPPDASEEELTAIVEAHQARVLLSEARLLGALSSLRGTPRCLEHTVVCGVVSPAELPALPGAVGASSAMAGLERRWGPATRALPDDDAIVLTADGRRDALTHRSVLSRLPTEPASSERHAAGMLHTREGVERMARLFRDGAHLSFMPAPQPSARLVVPG